MADIDADALCAAYLDRTQDLMRAILETERDSLDRAAARLADQIAADRLVHVFGPGGHSNLAAQEIFFRAGGLMHVSAILDEGTLLSNGALRSMAMSARSCRFCLVGWRAGWSGAVWSAWPRELTPMTKVPRRFASIAASISAALMP